MIFVQEIVQENFCGQLFAVLVPSHLCLSLKHSHSPLTDSSSHVQNVRCGPYQLRGCRAEYPNSVSGPYRRALAQATQSHWRERHTAQRLCPRTILAMVTHASEATFAKVDFELLHNHCSLLSHLISLAGK